MLNVPERLFSTFGIMVDPPSNETPHFGISENQIVSAINADAELLSRPLDQKSEVVILKVHDTSAWAILPAEGIELASVARLLS